jgi:hypothetical protein
MNQWCSLRCPEEDGLNDEWFTSKASDATGVAWSLDGHGVAARLVPMPYAYNLKTWCSDSNFIGLHCVLMGTRFDLVAWSRGTCFSSTLRSLVDNLRDDDDEGCRARVRPFSLHHPVFILALRSLYSFVEHVEQRSVTTGSSAWNVDSFWLDFITMRLALRNAMHLHMLRGLAGDLMTGNYTELLWHLWPCGAVIALFRTADNKRVTKVRQSLGRGTRKKQQQEQTELSLGYEELKKKESPHWQEVDLCNDVMLALLSDLDTNSQDVTNVLLPLSDLLAASFATHENTPADTIRCVSLMRLVISHHCRSPKDPVLREYAVLCVISMIEHLHPTNIVKLGPFEKGRIQTGERFKLQ